MKIRKLAIILLMITFLIILGTKAYATTGTINEDAAKLRKQPDSKTVLDLLDEGDEVEILEELEGWYKVKATTELGKVTGYVSEELIDVEKNIQTEEIVETPVQQPTQEPELNQTTSTDVIVEVPTISSNEIKEDNQITITQEISVKAIPLMNSIETGKVTGNITIIEILNDWARIENDTECGWIRINTLKNSVTKNEETVPDTPVEDVSEEKTAETMEETTNAQEPDKTTEPEKKENEEILNKIGYVSAEGLRVRKGPSTDSEEIDSLSKNDKVEIVGKTGKWYKIDLDGRTGYVSAKYISDTKLPETTSRSGSTLRDETVEKTEEVEEIQQEEEPKVEETSETSEPVTSGTTGAAVVEYAKQYLGYKYVSGGTSPGTGFDCSGFTQYVYKHFGVSLNRTSGAQINNGIAVEKSDLQPGDIVLFNNDANTRIGHVGIYVGDGNFIHASNPSDGVKITTLLSGYYKQRYVGARRVI